MNEAPLLQLKSQDQVVEHGNNIEHNSSNLSLLLFFVGLLMYIIEIRVYNKPIVFILALFLSGYQIIYEGFADTIKLAVKYKCIKPNVHLLMTLSAIGALFIKEYSEAGLLIVIFSTAHYLEDYASERSNKEITNLLKLNPTTDRRILTDGSIEIVNVTDLVISDKLRVLNVDQITTDGFVTEGTSAIDQSMITGDANKTTQSISNQLHVDKVIADVMPEAKSSITHNLKSDNGNVAMVCDGVNYAPALVMSDIGFAMGSGTDITIDAADAVFMGNDLNKITYTHKISKKLRIIIIQNIIFAMLVVLLLVTMNVFGVVDISSAELIHEGSTLLVIMNGLRLLKQLD